MRTEVSTKVGCNLTTSCATSKRCVCAMLPLVAGRMPAPLGVRRNVTIVPVRHHVGGGAMRRPDASELVALATIAEVLITDYFIIKAGKRAHTRMLGDNWKYAVAGVGYIAFHVAFADKLPWWADVFGILGKVTGVHPKETVTNVTEKAIDSMVRV